MRMTTNEILSGIESLSPIYYRLTQRNQSVSISNNEKVLLRNIWMNVTGTELTLSCNDCIFQALKYLVTYMNKERSRNLTPPVDTLAVRDLTPPVKTKKK